MKRWRKRLTVFSLLAAGCLIWNLSGVGVKADEAVPQMHLEIQQSSTVSEEGINVTLSYEPKELTAEDFLDTYKVTASTVDSNAKNGLYVTGGTLVVNVTSGQVAKSAITFGNSEAPNYDNACVKVESNKEIQWPYDYATSLLGDPALFTAWDPTMGQNELGLFCIVTYNGNDYLVHFPVKVTCEDFFTDISFWRVYESDGSPAANHFVTGEEAGGQLIGDTYTVDLSAYDAHFAAVNACVPTYSLGATGMNTTDVWKIGGTVKAYKSDIALAKRENPLEITVQNMNGTKKTFKIVINMPWNLDRASTFDESLIQNVYVENQQQTSKFPQISPGKKVKIVFNIDADKKLTGVNFSEGGMETKIVDNSVEFVMPKSNVKLESLEVDEVALEEHQIVGNIVTADGENNFAPPLIIKVDGKDFTAATKGQKVSIQSVPMDPRYNGFCGFKFDHWESNTIEIPTGSESQETLTFTMPDNDVRINAIYVKTGASITVGISNPLAGNVDIGNTNVGAYSRTSDGEKSITELCRKDQTYKINILNFNTTGYRFKGWVDARGVEIPTQDTDNIKWNTITDVKSQITYQYPQITVTDETASMTFIASFEAKTACTLTFTSSDENKGTVVASVDGTSIKSGENTIYDGDVVTLKAEKKTGYKFAGWEVTSPADVSVTFANAAAEETTFTMPKITSGSLTIQGVFEVDPAYLSPDCELTKVELLKKDDGTVVKQANKNGTTFTIKLSAKDMSLEEAGNLTGGAYMLRLTYPETATAKMDGGFGDGENGDDRWLTGITNGIGKGGKETFTITAENRTNKNTYTIAIEYDDRPTLTAGTVKRVSDTEASVGFRSSSAGTYYWAVVDAGEAKPDIPTNGAGTTFKYADRENTIKLTSLTAGAKDLYIVVKNDDDSTNVKISDALKISIPAFGGAETTYKVNVTGSLPGGKLTVDKKEAKAGETVIVTVTPDSGKKMTTNSLIYSQSSAPYEVVHIDEKTKQFIMPAYELSVSCRFEDENSSTTPETTTGKIGAFVVNGVSGTVDNTTGTITVTLPNGTDLTSLAPVITISGAKSISPASGATVNLSSPVTYTLTLEDGTTKTYTVRAYVEGPSKSDQLWNDMLNNVDGSPDHSGSKTWWKKAKDLKKHNDYPEYW